MSVPTIRIREQTWLVSEVRKDGLTTISEVPGELIGGVLETKEVPGRVQVFDSGLANVLLDFACDKPHQKSERLLTKPKRHAGLTVFLQGKGGVAVIFHQSFDVGQGIYKIQQILEKAFEPQWLQCYEKNLDTAVTDLLIEGFPTKPKYLYVQTCSGTVTMKFNSQNSPSWTLAAKDLFCFPFEQLYLSWTAQSGLRLTFYISNREIKKTTLA